MLKLLIGRGGATGEPAPWGTWRSRWARANVSWRLIAYQAPPGHSVLLLSGGSDCSLAPGSFEPGAIAEPIRAGPPGAPTPARKRRYAATTRLACCGSPAPPSPPPPRRPAP